MDARKSRLPTFGCFPDVVSHGQEEHTKTNAVLARSLHQPAGSSGVQFSDIIAETKAEYCPDGPPSGGVQFHSEVDRHALLSPLSPMTAKPPDGVNTVALDSYQSLPVSMATQDDMTLVEAVPGKAGADTSLGASSGGGRGDSGTGVAGSSSPVRPVPKPKPVPRPRNLLSIPPPPPRRSSLPHYQEQQQRGALSHRHVQPEQCVRANNLQGRPMAAGKNSGVKPTASCLPTVGVLVPPYRSRLGNVSSSAINGSFHARPREMEQAKGAVVSQSATALCSATRIANSEASNTSAVGQGPVLAWPVETDSIAVGRSLSQPGNKHESGPEFAGLEKLAFISEDIACADTNLESPNGSWHKDCQSVDEVQSCWTGKAQTSEDTDSLSETHHVCISHQTSSPSPIAVNKMDNWSDNSSNFADNKLAIIHERQDTLQDEHLSAGISESDYDSLGRYWDGSMEDSNCPSLGPVPAPRRHTSQESFTSGMKSPILNSCVAAYSNNASRESLHSGSSIDMCQSSVRSAPMFSTRNSPSPGNSGMDMQHPSWSSRDLHSPGGHHYSAKMGTAGSFGSVNYVISSDSTSPSPSPNNSLDKKKHSDAFNVENNCMNQGYVRMESPVRGWTGRQSPAVGSYSRSRASPVLIGQAGAVFFPTTPARRYSSPSCGVKMAEMRAASKRHAGDKSKSPSPEVESRGKSHVEYKRSHSHSGVASYISGAPGRLSRPNSAELSSKGSSPSLDYTTEPLYETIDFGDNISPSPSGSLVCSQESISQAPHNEHGSANFDLGMQVYAGVKPACGTARFIPNPRERSSYPPQGRRLIPPSSGSGRRSLPQTPQCHTTAAYKTVTHSHSGTCGQDFVSMGKPPIATNSSPSLSTRRKFQGQVVSGKPQKHDSAGGTRVKVDSDGRPPCVSWPQSGEAHQMSHIEQDKLCCNTLDRTSQEANISGHVTVCSPTQELSTLVQSQHDTSKSHNKMLASSDANTNRFQGQQQPTQKASQLKFRPNVKSRVSGSKPARGVDNIKAIPQPKDKYESCVNSAVENCNERVNRDLNLAIQDDGSSELTGEINSLTRSTQSKLEMKINKNAKSQFSNNKDLVSGEKHVTKLGSGSGQKNRLHSRGSREKLAKQPSKKVVRSYNAPLYPSDSDHSNSCHSSCENLHDTGTPSGMPRRRKQTRKAAAAASLSRTSSLSSSRSSLASNSSATGLVCTPSLQASKRGLPVRKNGMQSGVVNRETKGQSQQPSTAICRRGSAQNTNIAIEDSAARNLCQSPTSLTRVIPDQPKNIQNINNKKPLVNSPKTARKIGSGIPKGGSGSRSSALTNPKGVGSKGQVGNVPGKSFSQGATGSENKKTVPSPASKHSNSACNVQDNIPQISSNAAAGSTSPPVCQYGLTNLSCSTNAQTARNSKMAAQPHSPTRTSRTSPTGTKSVPGASKSSITPPSKLSPPSSTSKALSTTNTSRGGSSIPSSNSKSGKSPGKTAVSNTSPERASVSIQTEASALQSSRGPATVTKSGIGARSKLIRPQVGASKQMATKFQNNSGNADTGKELPQERENSAARKPSLMQKPRGGSRLAHPKSRLASPPSKDNTSQSTLKLSPEEKDDILANNLDNSKAFPQKSMADKCVVKSLACVEKTESVAVAKCSSPPGSNTSKLSKVKLGEGSGQAVEKTNVNKPIPAVRVAGPSIAGSTSRPSNLAIPGSYLRKPGIPENSQKKISTDSSLSNSCENKGNVTTRCEPGDGTVISSSETGKCGNRQSDTIMVDCETLHESPRFENSGMIGMQSGAKPAAELMSGAGTPDGKGELEKGKCFENIPQRGNTKKQENVTTSSGDRCKQACQSPQSAGMSGWVMHTEANANSINQECITTVSLDSDLPGVPRQADSQERGVNDTSPGVYFVDAIECQARATKSVFASDETSQNSALVHTVQSDADNINTCGTDLDFQCATVQPIFVGGLAQATMQSLPGSSDKNSVLIKGGLKSDFSPEESNSNSEGVPDGEGGGMQDSAIFSDPENESTSLPGPQNEKCVPSDVASQTEASGILHSHQTTVPKNIPASNQNSQNVTTNQKSLVVKNDVCHEISVSDFGNQTPPAVKSTSSKVDLGPGSHLETDIVLENKSPKQAVISGNLCLQTSKSESPRDRLSKRGNDRVMQWIRSQEQISAADRTPPSLGHLAKHSQVAENNPDWVTYRNSPEGVHLDSHLGTFSKPIPGAHFLGHPQPEVAPRGLQPKLVAPSCLSDLDNHDVTLQDPVKCVNKVIESIFENKPIANTKGKIGISNSNPNSAGQLDIIRCESEDTLTASDFENVFDIVEKEARRISSDLSRLSSHALQDQSLKHGHSLDSNMFVKDGDKKPVSDLAIRHVLSLDSGKFREGGTCREFVKTESQNTIKADESDNVNNEMLCRDRNSLTAENFEIESCDIDKSQLSPSLYGEGIESPEHNSSDPGMSLGQNGIKSDLGTTTMGPGGNRDVTASLLSESAAHVELHISKKPVPSPSQFEVNSGDLDLMTDNMPSRCGGHIVGKLEDPKDDSALLLANSFACDNESDSIQASCQENKQVSTSHELAQTGLGGSLNDNGHGHKPINVTCPLSVSASKTGSQVENKHILMDESAEFQHKIKSNSPCTPPQDTGPSDLFLCYDTESDLNTSVSSADPMFGIGSDNYENMVDDTLEAFHSGGSSQESAEPTDETETSSEGSSCGKLPQQFTSLSQNNADIPSDENIDPVPTRAVSSPNLRRKFDKQKKAASASASAFLLGNSSLKRTHATSSLNVDVDSEQLVMFKSLGNVNKEVASSDTSLNVEEEETEADRMVQSDIGEFGGGWSSKDDLSEVEDLGPKREDEIQEMARFINRHYSISEEVEEEEDTEEEEETPTNEKVFCDIQSDTTPTEESRPGFGDDEVDGMAVVRPDSESDDTVQASGKENSVPTSPEPDFDLRSSAVSPDLESMPRGGSFMNLSDGHTSESDSSGVTSMKDDELEALGDSFERRSQMSAPEMGSTSSRFGWQNSSTFKSRTLPLNLWGDRSKLKSSSPKLGRLFGNAGPSKGGGVIAKATALPGPSQTGIPGPSQICGPRGKVGLVRDSLLKSFAPKELPKRSLPVPVATATRGDEGYWTMQSHNNKSRGGFRLQGDRKNKV